MIDWPISLVASSDEATYIRIDVSPCQSSTLRPSLAPSLPCGRIEYVPHLVDSPAVDARLRNCSPSAFTTSTCASWLWGGVESQTMRMTVPFSV